MNFQVRIPGAIEDAIARWNLKTEIRRRFLRKLKDELGEHPFRVGRIISVAPIRILHFPFDIPDVSLTHRFVVSFEPNETSRYVALLNVWHSLIGADADAATMQQATDDCTTQPLHVESRRTPPSVH